jgi:predicted nucleotidyltransferase
MSNKKLQAFSSFTNRVLKEKNPLFNIPEFICLHGSYAYGMETENSDVDISGVFISKIDNYFGFKKIEQIQIARIDGSGEKDTVFELHKFIDLAAENNPNIIEKLYLDKESTLYCSPVFQKVIDNRHLFLSRKARHSFSGYAFAQLKRISSHYNWIENPPTEPDPEKYKITRYKNKVTGKIIPESDYINKMNRSEQLSQAIGNNDNMFEGPDNWELVHIVKKEYNEARKKYDQYLDWKKNRNEERSKLEEDFGYDTKHGAHLVRLLLQARNILQKGFINVKLDGEDLKLVKDVRNGNLPYKDLLIFSQDMEKEISGLYETSKLQYEADSEAINKLSVEILKEYFKNK